MLQREITRPNTCLVKLAPVYIRKKQFYASEMQKTDKTAPTTSVCNYQTISAHGMHDKPN